MAEELEKCRGIARWSWLGLHRPASLLTGGQGVDPFFRWVEDPQNVSYQVGGAADSSPHVVHVHFLSLQLQRASGITVQMSYRLV